MRYYLDSYIGDGGLLNPFRPAADADVAGWSAIDLRPDNTVRAGRCLLASPVVLPAQAGRFDLGDALDDASPAVKAGLESRLGVTLDNARPRQIIAALLLFHARTDGTRWKPLRAGADRAYRIMLGGQNIFAQPVVGGGAVVTENFNTTDGTTLGPTIAWTEITGDWTIVSNRANVLTLSGGVALARAEADLSGSHHYAQAEDWSGATVSNTPGICARFDPAATTFYLFRREVDALDTKLQKVVAGVTTTLATGTSSGSGGGGVVLRLEVTGSNLVGKKSGSVEASVTDTAITGFTRTGLWAAAGGGNRIKFDNFEASDLIAARSYGAAVGVGAATAGVKSFGSVV